MGFEQRERADVTHLVGEFLRAVTLTLGSRAGYKHRGEGMQEDDNLEEI